MYFINVLKNMAIDPNEYLEMVNDNATKHKYPRVYFSNDNIHKLMIIDPSNNHIIRFGSSINNDYIIYQLLEEMKKVKNGTAMIRRKAYLARATKIKGEWKNNKFSKNNLAIKILWS